MRNPYQIKNILDTRNSAKLYREFLKATSNLSEDKRDMMIDQQVMGFLHHLLHDIQGHARNHVAKNEENSQMDKQKESNNIEMDSLKEKIKSTLQKIVSEFGEFRLTSPDDLPHIPHILEKHPVLQKVILALVNHKMDINDAATTIVEQIGNEEEHDVSNLESTKFEKSAANFGMFGAYSFPSYPIAFSSSAMSRFRPTPPFLTNTSTKPDERFIELLMQLKDRPEDVKEEEIRPVVPADEAHETLAQRAGVPHYLIPSDETTSKQAAMKYIKSRMNARIPRTALNKYREMKPFYGRD